MWRRNNNVKCDELIRTLKKISEINSIVFWGGNIKGNNKSLPVGIFTLRDIIKQYNVDRDNPNSQVNIVDLQKRLLENFKSLASEELYSLDASYPNAVKLYKILGDPTPRKIKELEKLYEKTVTAAANQIGLRADFECLHRIKAVYKFHNDYFREADPLRNLKITLEDHEKDFKQYIRKNSNAIDMPPMQRMLNYLSSRCPEWTDKEKFSKWLYQSMRVYALEHLCKDEYFLKAFGAPESLANVLAGTSYGSFFIGLGIIPELNKDNVNKIEREIMRLALGDKYFNKIFKDMDDVLTFIRAIELNEPFPKTEETFKERDSYLYNLGEKIAGSPEMMNELVNILSDKKQELFKYEGFSKILSGVTNKCPNLGNLIEEANAEVAPTSRPAH